MRHRDVGFFTRTRFPGATWDVNAFAPRVSVSETRPLCLNSDEDTSRQSVENARVTRRDISDAFGFEDPSCIVFRETCARFNNERV